MQPPTMPLSGSSGAPETMPMLAGAQKEKLKEQFSHAAKRFGGLWKMLFFVAAACVVAAATVGILSAVLHPTEGVFSIFDIVDQVYLIFFGLLMLIIDCPVEHPKIQATKLSIYKYLLFMTRFTGRGVWFLFLACMIVGTLWDNGVSTFLGFILGGYVAAVGIISTVFGLRKSVSLERVRRRVLERMDQIAALVPPNGMTKDQFNAMASELKGVNFTDDDLNYIVNALSFTVKADDIISREEFAEWTRGRMTIL